MPAMRATILAMSLVACAPDTLAVEADQDPHASAEATVVIPLERPRAETPRASLDIPDKCDRLLLIDVTLEDGRTVERLSKVRPAWLRNGRERWERQLQLRREIQIVAEEMGADALAAEMIWRKAIYESSGNPGNVHIRSRDIEANRRAAGKGRRRSTERWLRATVPVHKRTKFGVRVVDHHDAWALGRGLFGMVTGLHAHRWSTDAPPWSLCDPIIATVTIIWAMRAGLAECRGSTLRDAYRRFSSGKCAIRDDELEERFDRLARGKVRGLRLDPFDPDTPAVLGDRWPESSADRSALLARLRKRVTERRTSTN